MSGSKKNEISRIVIDSSCYTIISSAMGVCALDMVWRCIQSYCSMFRVEKHRPQSRKKKEMIDPITALAGIQTAVALIKKVSKTVDDVSSLGPVLGKYFDAKSTATKAVVEAKNSGNKSSMGTAIQIEMALDQAVQFEKELQLLFMQSGKIDVWNKIKARAAAMDVEAAHNARRAKEAAAKRKREIQEAIEFSLAMVFCIGVLIGMGIVVYELIAYCKLYGCGQ